MKVRIQDQGPRRGYRGRAEGSLAPASERKTINGLNTVNARCMIVLLTQSIYRLKTENLGSLTNDGREILHPDNIRELKHEHQRFSTRRRQPEGNFTSDPRFPPTSLAVATRRRRYFAKFDVACKT